MELFEEEFEEYAPADELDVNIARETGDEVEDGSAGVENRDEADYNEVIQDFRVIAEVLYGFYGEYVELVRKE